MWFTSLAQLLSGATWRVLAASMLAMFPRSGLAQDIAPDHVFAGRLFDLRTAVEIRADPVESPALTAPHAVSADSQFVYILDAAVSAVHRFDHRGTWLSGFGGSGYGPGEFRRPSAMGWRADTLWVADPGLGRISFFDRTGAFLRSTTFNIVTGQAIAMPQRTLGRSLISTPYVPLATTSPMDSTPILRFSDNGTIHDTLAWAPLGQVAVTVAAPVVGSGRPHVVTIPHAFDLQSLVAHDPRGRWIYIGSWRRDHNGEEFFELRRLTELGDTVTTLILPFRRSGRSLGDVRTYAAARYEEMPAAIRAQLDFQDVVDTFRQQLPAPVLPDVDAMLADDDGVIWFRTTSSRSRDGRETWVAYQLDGRLVGLVALPDKHTLISVTQGMLWTRSEDSFGLPTIRGLLPISPETSG